MEAKQETLEDKTESLTKEVTTLLESTKKANVRRFAQTQETLDFLADELTFTTPSKSQTKTRRCGKTAMAPVQEDNIPSSPHFAGTGANGPFVPMLPPEEAHVPDEGSSPPLDVAVAHHKGSNDAAGHDDDTTSSDDSASDKGWLVSQVHSNKRKKKKKNKKKARK